MKIAIANPQGALPILDARLLPENAAQVASNVDLRSGTLRPQKGVGAQATLPATINPANLYHYNVGNNGAGYWFSWGDEYDIDVVRSPIANDAYARVYWTGQGAPKMTTLALATGGTEPYPSDWLELGIPAPSSAPSVSEPVGRETPPNTAIETVYVVTYVSQYGEEGPPSDPSRTILRWDMVDDAPQGGEVEVSLPPAPSSDYDITKKRLYRAESGGEFQLVTELPVSAGSYTDDTLSEKLGRALLSLTWDRPNPGMTGLTALPNGILAGFFDNTLCFCEPYLPHAWPVNYQLAFQENIVGIAAISAGLLVVTEGKPWIVTGHTPAAMAQMELDVNQPGIAKRSVVDMGGYALYASHDGLVAVGGSEARVVTQTVLTREQWQALNPDTIHAYRYDGKYLAFYEGGCFTFTPGQGIEFHDVTAQAGYYDLLTDTLYLIQGTDIVTWEGGPAMTYTWRSKINEFPPGAAGFTCGKVIAYDYPVTLRLYADGVKALDQPIQSAGMFRLPPGYTLARDWEIELSGTNEVSSVQIATSPGELI
ncbi:hypothetical protein [uncultured Marinobacter sp.]|uniref:hypothetical protein n=1 Tax=uncultured Marinobacter sp. TaxID=187379 RepID=UPI00258868A1|nr:hypothetical protein [uncultured Marinobacter sp.]